MKGYANKEFLLDEFITHTMGLDNINEAFDLMRDGKRYCYQICITKEFANNLTFKILYK